MTTIESAPRPTSRRLLRKLAALVLGGVASFGALELFVRAFVSVREVGPSFTEWHPEDGVAMRRSIDVRRIHPEFEMRLATNSDGYRGPELPARIERSVLFLGDSFTMGYGVDDEECFVSLLAARAPLGWTMVNSGIGGTGNGRWLHVLERERERLAPRVVVLQVCGNDVDDNLTEALYSLDAQGALVRHAPRPLGGARRLQAVLDALPGVSYLRIVGLARQIASRARARGAAPADPAPPAVRAPDEARAPKADPGLALTLALIRSAAVRARDLGAVPIVLECELRPELESALASLAAELDIARVRVPTKAERPELYFRVDGHWNEAGQAAAAELLWGELQAPRYGLVGDGGR